MHASLYLLSCYGYQTSTTLFKKVATLHWSIIALNKCCNGAFVFRFLLTWYQKGMHACSNFFSICASGYSSILEWYIFFTLRKHCVTLYALFLYISQNHFWNSWTFFKLQRIFETWQLVLAHGVPGQHFSCRSGNSVTVFLAAAQKTYVLRKQSKWFF